MNLRKLYKIGAALAMVLTLAGTACAFTPVTRAAGTQFITFDKFSGHAGTTVNVTGAGFSGNEKLAVYIGSISGTPATTAVTDPNGNLSVAVTIPSTEVSGSLPITVADFDAGINASNNFFVEGYFPSISFNSSGNHPGDVIVIAGKDFAPGEQVNISMSTFSTSATADSKGAFQGATVMIPKLSPDTYKIKAIGQTSAGEAVGFFYVSGYYGNATPDEYYVMPEESVTFSGGGFAKNEKIQITDAATGMLVSAFNADKDGVFVSQGKVMIPWSDAGTVQTFHIAGVDSGAGNDVKVQVGKLSPQMAPSAFFAPVGAPMSFTGWNFAKNEGVNIFVDDSTTPIATPITDSTTTFHNAVINVPLSWSGQSKTFTAVGVHSGAQVKVTVRFSQFYPQINPSSYSVKGGQSINITGFSFAPNEKIDLSLQGDSGTAQTATVTSDSKGNISSDPFKIPFNVSKLTVTATGEETGAQASRDLKVGIFNPWVTANSYYVLPGQSISLSGADFADNEKISVSDSKNVVATLAADQNGAILQNKADNIKIPFGSSGEIAYTLTGSDSNAQGTVAISVAQFHPWIISDQYFVARGSLINVSANGFAKGEGVTIQLGSSTEDVITDQNGNATQIPVMVPSDALSQSELNLKATGDLSGATTSQIIKIK